MNKEMSNFYKLTVAHDLIMFLLNMYVHGLPSELKIEKTNQILQAWEKRLNFEIKTLTDNTIKNVVSDGAMDSDVAAILTQIHQIEPTMLREEFKEEVKKVALRGFTQQT